MLLFISLIIFVLVSRLRHVYISLGNLSDQVASMIVYGDMVISSSLAFLPPRLPFRVLEAKGYPTIPYSKLNPPFAIGRAKYAQ